MKTTGGCYCKAVRFAFEGEPAMKAQCHCRECQYFSGGQPNFFLALPEEGLTLLSGAEVIASFARDDLPNAVTRQFCATCGTPLWTISPRVPGALIVKAGVFDDPAALGGPQVIVQTADAQPFHHIPEGIPAFERFPG